MTDSEDNVYIEVKTPDKIYDQLQTIAAVQGVTVEELAASMLAHEVGGDKIERPVDDNE